MVALISVISFMFTSCKEGDEDTTPVITGVRICDPEAADSLFSKSSQGQTVAIIGRNLNDIRKITINGYNVGFSSTMNTDHSVIINIPSESKGFPLGAFNPDVTEEIYIETTHGSCTYPFQVLTAAPSLTRIQCAYPRKTGDVLNVYGKNLVSINKVYFTDVKAAELDTTKWEEVPGNHIDGNYKTVVMEHYLDNKTQNYTTDSQLAVNIPELPFDEGTFVIECAAGTVYIPYTKLPGVPVIKSISTDMPEIGENLIIKGNEFVQIESVTFGDVTYTADEMVIAESEDEINILVTKVPTKGNSNPTLVLKTVGGEAKVEHFYDYSTLLVDFDATDAPTDNGWDPNASYESAASAGTSWLSTGRYARINVESEGTQWWGKMVFYRYNWEDNIFPLPGNDVISEDTPATDIYLAMNVYNNGSDYNNGVFSGYLRYTIWPPTADTGSTDGYQYDNFEWDDYEAGTFLNPAGPVLADCEGNAPTGKWYRHVFCLNNIPAYQGLTYKDIMALGIGNIRIQSINQSTKQGKIDICIDNIRLIKKNW